MSLLFMIQIVNQTGSLVCVSRCIAMHQKYARTDSPVVPDACQTMHVASMQSFAGHKRSHTATGKFCTFKILYFQITYHAKKNCDSYADKPGRGKIYRE